MKMKINVTIEVNEDYETLQDIKKHFVNVDDGYFMEKINQAFELTLITIYRGDHDRKSKTKYKTIVDVPKPHKASKGKRTPIPKIRDGVLYEYDETTSEFKEVGKIGSYEFLSFLDWQKSFNYKTSHGLSFTGTRHKNGVWYARKRLNGKAHNIYLGDHNDFTEKKLSEAAFKISQRKLM